MSDKKYSVFISSTYEDLKEERTAVLRAILQHGHFPLGMELWGAADEQQWQIIQRQIDVADYYVVIVAHRYGSLSETGVSWTEREYDYAVEKGVPVLGFVIHDDAIWPPKYVDKAGDASCLDRFKAKVTNRPVSFWKTKDELNTCLVLALSRQMQSTPRPGWIRGSKSPRKRSVRVTAQRNMNEGSTIDQAAGSVLVYDDLVKLVQSGKFITAKDENGVGQQMDVPNEMIQMASIDLTRGEGKWLTNIDENKMIGIESITLHPGDRLFLRARETIQMPANLIGRLAGMSDLLMMGVQIVSGLHIEPGWKGKPFVMLHHVGTEDVEIGFGDPFLSMELHQLPRAPNVPNLGGSIKAIVPSETIVKLKGAP